MFHRESKELSHSFQAWFFFYCWKDTSAMSSNSTFMALSNELLTLKKKNPFQDTSGLGKKKNHREKDQVNRLVTTVLQCAFWGALQTDTQRIVSVDILWVKRVRIFPAIILISFCTLSKAVTGRPHFRLAD